MKYTFLSKLNYESLTLKPGQVKIKYLEYFFMIGKHFNQVPDASKSCHTMLPFLISHGPMLSDSWSIVKSNN
jgi:hypothetical protein